jgi:hypothetical protein
MENILHGTKQEESLSAEAVRFINNIDFTNIFRHIVTNQQQNEANSLCADIPKEKKLSRRSIEIDSGFL